MPTRETYPGGSYVDGLPSGERCVLFFGSHVETHLGKFVPDRPEQGPLFLRCTRVGGFRFAGQQHDGMGALEWTEATGFRVIPPPACGSSPVIYDNAGKLLVSACGPVGSQGYRFVAASGRVYTGDDTYYDGASDLSEWSAYDAFKIGIGHSEGGVIVWDGSQRRVLEAGDCRFVRVQGDGDRVAISFVKDMGQPSQAAVIWRATLAELRALPAAALPGVPKAPVPPIPIPPPQPKPEPVPMLDHTDIVAAIRNRFPAVIDDPTCFAITNEVANNAVVKAEGWGLLKAPSGGRGFVVNGQNYRVQRLCKPDGTLLQVLGSSGGGAAIAEWSISTGDPNATPANWAPALPINITPVPIPIPSPPAPQLGPDFAALLAQVAANLNDAKSQLAEIKARQDAQDEAIAKLASQPTPSGAKKGDSVFVRGHVTVFGVRSAEATWVGKIGVPDA